MKKTISIFSLLFGMLMSVSFLTACGDDDNDSIVGTWYIVTEDHGVDEYTEVTFSADGTCSRREYKADRTTLTEADWGTYKTEGNVLSIWWDSEKGYGAWSVTFSISGNKMTTSEGGGSVWTRK